MTQEDGNRKIPLGELMFSNVDGMPREGGEVPGGWG